MSDSYTAAALRDPQAATLARRRAMAERLMAQSTQQDFRNPLAIGATIAQSLAGALMGRQADSELREYGEGQRTEATQFMARLLGGAGGAGGPSALPAGPAAPVPASPDAGPVTSTPLPPVGGAPGGDYINRLVAMESGGDPNARNPRSTATGATQFIDSTWRDFARANPDRFAGMNDQQILAARNDPNLSRQAAEWYRGQNLSALSGQGLPANDGTAALAHRFGPQGAAALLRADPAAPIDGLVGPQVMQANPDLNGRTVGQVVSQYAQRFGGGAPAPQPQPTPTGTPAPPAINYQVAALEAMQSNNPRIRELAPILAQMQRSAPPVTTAAPGSALIRNGEVIGQVPDRPRENDLLLAQWRQLQALGENATPAQIAERDLLGRRLGGSGVNVNVPVNTERGFYGELAQRGGQRIDALQQQASQSVEALRSAQRVQALLANGAITGTGAGAREAIERAFVTAGLVDGQRVANTGQLMTEMANATLAAASNLPGATSDRDILFLREAAAGRLDLTAETIRRVVQIAADQSSRTIRRYNEIATGLADDPNVPAPMRLLYRPIEMPRQDAVAAPAQQQQSGVPRPRNAAEMNALPPGTVYFAPDGSLRRRP